MKYEYADDLEILHLVFSSPCNRWKREISGEIRRKAM